MINQRLCDIQITYTMLELIKNRRIDSWSICIKDSRDSSVLSFTLICYANTRGAWYYNFKQSIEKLPTEKRENENTSHPRRSSKWSTKKVQDGPRTSFKWNILKRNVCILNEEKADMQMYWIMAIHDKSLGLDWISVEFER